jgi:hypothetical protein
LTVTLCEVTEPIDKIPLTWLPSPDKWVPACAGMTRYDKLRTS